MIWNRWQCFILSFFSDMQGHDFFIEENLGRGKEIFREYFLYALHCKRCAIHQLMLSYDGDREVGSTVFESDDIRLSI